jgi:tetratricopeptide (TPR) repeat protein
MAEISLREYCEQIEGMIDQGRYSQAVAHAKHVLGAYPKCVAAYRLLGRAMLEARQDDNALDMFLRVLSADPEDMLSWVAMSEIYDRRDELGAAVWCLERAFELSVDNQLVGEELRQLYGRRDGAEPQRVELTRGALARLYLKGDLLSRSVSEFRDLLDEQPNRVDLEVVFAEALWRNEQRLEASEVCQRTLDKLPYCLKANLLLGEIWVTSGREEGQTYLRRAEVLDPQNAMAQALFGNASPLPAQDVRIAPLEYKPVAAEERPAWMAGVEAASIEGPPLTEGEAKLVDIAAALEAQIEIPSWLEEIDVAESGEAPQVPDFMALEEEESVEAEEVAFAPEEEVPEWLAGVGEDIEAAVGARDVGLEPIAGFAIEEEDMVNDQVPDWLAGLSAEPVGGEEESPGEGQVPDFLAEMGGGAFAEEVVSPEEEVPDWLAGLREQAVEDTQELPPAEPVRAEIPDWMQELAPSGIEEPAPAEAAEAIPSEAEEVAPPWLEGEGMPSGEEALAWLEQLTAGKEEELQAQVEAEIEARTAEIMGRPKVEEPVVEEPAPVEAPPEPVRAEIPDWMQELAPAEAAPSEAEGPVPSADKMSEAEGAFGWMAFGELEAEVTKEFAPGEAEEPAVSAEGMFEAEEPVPSADKMSEVEGAFGWTAFGEPEVFAPSEIGEAAPAMEEAAPVPPVEEPPLAVVEEVMAEAVAAPMVEELVPSAVEEIVVPSAEEIEAPPKAPLEEARAPVAPPSEVARPEVRAAPPRAAAPLQPRPPRPSVEPADPFAAEKAYLKENPRDYDARLNLARAQWQAGKRGEALEAYSRLVRAGKLLDIVTTELEEYLEQWPDVSTQRVLGDAYMKSNQLDRALNLYREALENL